MGGRGVVNPGGGGPPPGNTPGLGTFKSLIPLEPGGQNQQRGHAAKAGLPSVSCVFDGADVEACENSGGNPVKVGKVTVAG